MIAFSQLGQRSRLGNHLFQYAFLRATAQRLGVQFHCPGWAGDEFFDLDDASLRESAPDGIHAWYVEPPSYTGLNPSALDIRDGTEISGYFQTERYLSRTDVLRWYRFRDDRVASLKPRFAHLPLATATGLHVRLGDFATTYADLYYIARPEYYRRALQRLGNPADVIVFSDDIPKAREWLGDVARNAHFADDHEPFEGLYLQSQCRHFICSASTFSWWGAWLNTRPGRIVIAPEEGPMRPGAPVANKEFWPRDWVTLPALRKGVDGYRGAQLRRQFDRWRERLAFRSGGSTS